MPSFPVLAFSVRSFTGCENVESFESDEEFSTCWHRDLGERIGMSLVDSEGRCWTIQDVVIRGGVGSWPMRTLRFILRMKLYRVDYQLIEAGTMSLGEIQDRTVRAVLGNQDLWQDDELLAGESGPPVDDDVFWAMKEAVIRDTRSVPEIIEAMYRDLDPPAEGAEPARGV